MGLVDFLGSVYGMRHIAEVRSQFVFSQFVKTGMYFDEDMSRRALALALTISRSRY